VAENPKQLKTAVGGAVPVIVFLLHHILAHVADERLRKLQVRDEVLPFIALIDNRIDQEHFEGIVAEALGSSREAIHSEVKRLVETKNQTRPQFISTHETEKNHGVTVGRSATVRQYIDILREIVEPAEKQFLHSVIEELEAILPLYELSTDSVPDARLFFTAEADFERLSKGARQQEILHIATTWRQLAAKEAVNVIRDAIGKEGETEELLVRLATYQALLKQPPYNQDDIEKFNP